MNKTSERFRLGKNKQRRLRISEAYFVKKQQISSFHLWLSSSNNVIYLFCLGSLLYYYYFLCHVNFLKLAKADLCLNEVWMFCDDKIPLKRSALALGVKALALSRSYLKMSFLCVFRFHTKLIFRNFESFTAFKNGRNHGF